MRKLLKSISMIGITTAIALSATMAYFSDTETSTGNKISAGELDLLIADNSENFRNGVTATWMAENMQPGDERAFAVEKIELIKNLGSIEASHTEITCDYSVIEEIPCFESDTDCHTDDHPDEMAEEMIITKCVFHDGFCIDCLTGNKWDGYDPINGVCANNDLSPDPVEQSDDWKIEDLNGDGKASFYELKQNKLDDLPAVLNSPVFSFQMSVKFDEGAGNEFQGDAFNLTMAFTLNQDSSQ